MQGEAVLHPVFCGAFHERRAGRLQGGGAGARRGVFEVAGGAALQSGYAGALTAAAAGFNWGRQLFRRISGQPPAGAGVRRHALPGNAPPRRFWAGAGGAAGAGPGRRPCGAVRRTGHGAGGAFRRTGLFRGGHGDVPAGRGGVRGDRGRRQCDETDENGGITHVDFDR